MQQKEVCKGCTVAADRDPRKPLCLISGGSGARQPAHAPRCSRATSASLNAGGASVNSLTRLPYLRNALSFRPHSTRGKTQPKQHVMATCGVK
jgi:hypothetical protein